MVNMLEKRKNDFEKHSHLVSCKASNRMSRDLFPLFFSAAVAAFVVDDGLSQDLMINKPDYYTHEISI